MLLSKDLLKQLDLERNKIIYARITALNLQEHPIEQIEGRITQGSINVDGASAMRRSCSLTMITDQINVADYIWTFNTKFKLEIGVENNIDKNYPDIIWFKQGTYLITSFSSSLSANNFTINLQGKDKMCQLNGENGGTFLASVDFGKREEVDANGKIVSIKMLLQDIIREMIHTYGKEPFHNIIIEDIDEKALHLQEYTGTEPVYLVRPANGTNPRGEYTMIYYGDTTCYVNGFPTTLAQLDRYDNLLDYGHISTVFTFDLEEQIPYCAAKFEHGSVIGHIEIPFVYPTDLIANVGETVVSVLDKIKNVLGDFEYFYNLEGQFIFRKKPASINTAWSPEIKLGGDQAIVEGLAVASDIAYSFTGGELLTAFNNSPTMNNTKNDFSVWGQRNGNIPIHMRYAIDQKPLVYTTISVDDEELVVYNQKYGLNVLGQESKTYIATNVDYQQYLVEEKTQTIQFLFDCNSSEAIPYINAGGIYEPEINRLTITVSYPSGPKPILCDWREIIYMMAADFYKYNHLDSFALKIGQANQDLYPSGITGYEQYYEDIFSYWRDIYNMEQQYTKAFLWRPLEGDNTLDTLYQKQTVYTPVGDNNIPAGSNIYYKIESQTRAFKPYYKKARLRFPGIYIEPDTEKSIDHDNLYFESIIYKPIEESFRRSLCTLESVNPKNMHILKAIGYKKDLHELTDEMYVIKLIMNPEDTTQAMYILDVEPPAFPGAEPVQSSIKQVQEWQPYQKHYTIELASTVADISDNEIIYTKAPFQYYKPYSFEQGNNIKDTTMHAFVPVQDIYLNETYYELLDQSLIEVLPCENNETPIVSSILQPELNHLNTILTQANSLFTKDDNLGYFTLNTTHLTELMMIIKRLTYIKALCSTFVNQLNEEWTTTEEVSDSVAEYSNILSILTQELSTFYNTSMEIIDLLNSFNNETYDFVTGYDFGSFTKLLNERTQKINNLISHLTKRLLPQTAILNNYLFTPIIHETILPLLCNTKSNKIEELLAIVNAEDADINSLLASLGELASSEIIACSDLITVCARTRSILTQIKSQINKSSFKLTPFYTEVQNIKFNGKYYALEECTGYIRSKDFYQVGELHQYWHKNVYEAPWLLNFWFDFLTPSGELSQFSIPAIGARQQASNDNQVTAINYPNAPLVIFHRSEEPGHFTGYNYIDASTLIPHYEEIVLNAGVIMTSRGEPVEGAIGRSAMPLIDPRDNQQYTYWKCVLDNNKNLIWQGYDYDPLTNFLSNRAQGKTAKEAIDSLLYTHGCCAESVTITTIPVYYLEPNNKIYVYDAETGIEGKYLISKITVPLAYNGTMQITATRLIERI